MIGATTGAEVQGIEPLVKRKTNVWKIDICKFVRSGKLKVGKMSIWKLVVRKKPAPKVTL